MLEHLPIRLRRRLRVTLLTGSNALPCPVRPFRPPPPGHLMRLLSSHGPIALSSLCPWRSDGGPGAEYGICSEGTDCVDCGTRTSGGRRLQQGGSAEPSPSPTSMPSPSPGLEFETSSYSPSPLPKPFSPTPTTVESYEYLAANDILAALSAMLQPSPSPSPVPFPGGGGNYETASASPGPFSGDFLLESAPDDEPEQRPLPDEPPHCNDYDEPIFLDGTDVSGAQLLPFSVHPRRLPLCTLR